MFNPEVFQVYSPYRTLNVSWANTVFNNGSESQSAWWYNASGANYSNDMRVGYDVCGIYISNVTAATQYRGMDDNGTCSTALGDACMGALTTLASEAADMLVGYSDQSNRANLSRGVLPEVCNDVASTVQKAFPKECRTHFDTLEVAGLRMYYVHRPSNSWDR